MVCKDFYKIPAGHSVFNSPGVRVWIREHMGAPEGGELVIFGIWVFVTRVVGMVFAYGL